MNPTAADAASPPIAEGDPLHGLHVLFVPHERLGAVGGIQRYDRRMIEALAAVLGRRGGRLSVLSLAAPTPDMPPLPVPIAHSGGSLTRLAQRVAGLRRRDAPGLVILGHARLAPIGLALRARRRRPAVVLCVHGNEVWSPDPGRRPHPLRRAEIRRCCDAVLSVSRYTARRMTADYGMPEARFRILPNALDLPGGSLPPLPPVRPDHAPRLLTVSRMAAHDGPKGVAVAVAATARLAERFPGLRHVVIGDGPERPRLEAEARRLGAADAVLFAGRVDDAELARHYAEADVFVLPSAKEGFGIVFLEAWRHGLPVVCGDRDASAEVVENGVDGLTVDPRDPQAVADAVAGLLTRPERRAAMAAAGREKLCERYTDQRFRQILAGHLEALAAQWARA